MNECEQMYEYSKELLNIWLKKKTENFKKCPLFSVTVDLPKLKAYGKKDSCEIIGLPEILDDEEAVRLIKKAVDYIRDNYDLDVIAKF